MPRPPARCREHSVRGTNLRPWSQGDDNGLCGLFATVNAVRWLWPELRQKNEHEEEEVAALPTHLVQDRLSPKQFQALYLEGDELRYKSGIGTTLAELVILVTARGWTQDYEWYVHAPIAAKAGIKPAIIEAIRDGRRPTGMSEDEAIVYDFSSELHQNERVSDVTFARAEKRFGKAAVVDLVAINGYYTFLAMQLNMARYAIPKDGTPLPRFPE